MFKKMAVINKRPHNFRISEIHAEFYAGVNFAAPIPEGHVDGVAQVWLIHRNTIPLQQLKMSLVNVEGVYFLGAVFDDPVFYIT